MDKKVIIAVLVTAIVFGAAGFGGGMLLGKAGGSTRLAGTTGNFRMGQNGQAGANAANRSGRTGLVGKIVEAGKDSITVKSADGSTRTVYLSGTTAISKVASATVADLSVNTTITAMGTGTSGGDVTAQRITIGNDMGGFGGFRAPSMNGGGSGQNGQGGNSGFGGGGGEGGPPPGL
jgi:VCBS repeat-containing protein